MDVVPDRGKIVRSRLLDREPFRGLNLKEIGTVNYPGWFIEHPDAESRNAFRDSILVAYTNMRPHDEGDFYENSYVYRFNPFLNKEPGSSERTVFDYSSSCTMCQFVMLSAFFPELLGSNIVEFAPIMSKGKHVKDKMPISSDWILEHCWNCSLCGSALPGRYRSEYHPIVVKSCEGGENFPDRDESDYSDVADSYEALLLGMIPRKDQFILMNGAARDILAGTVGANYCKVWSNKDEEELRLHENHWYFTMYSEGIHPATNAAGVALRPRPGFVQNWLPKFGKRRVFPQTKRKHQDGEEEEEPWGPNGTSRLFFDLVKWYVTDTRPMAKDMESTSMRYALACIANVDG